MFKCNIPDCNSQQVNLSNPSDSFGCLELGFCYADTFYRQNSPLGIKNGPIGTAYFQPITRLE